MQQMIEILGYPEFFFGGMVFLSCQIGRFFEFGSHHALNVSSSKLIRTLSANDFADPKTFYAGLAAFIVASLAVYVSLCLIPKGVLLGWVKISGASNAGLFNVDTRSYPLVVASILIGLTQPIPFIKKIAAFQKDIFHRWIGVPDRVARISLHFSDQILFRSRTSSQLSGELKSILGEDWIGRIGLFANTGFYREFIRQMDFDTEERLSGLKEGSPREKKSVIQDLVFAACLAAVQQGGGRSLPKLAEALGVDMPPEPPTGPRQHPLGGVLIALILSMVLWFSLSMEWTRAAIASAPWIPSTGFLPTTLYTSSQYLVSNFIPTILCAFLVSVTVEPRSDLDDRDTSIPGIINRYAGLILAIVLLSMAYDYFQAFFDRGVSASGNFGASLIEFVQARAPMFALHSLVPALTALALIVFVVRTDLRERSVSMVLWALSISAISGAISFFYAAARLEYQFQMRMTEGGDFAFLVVALNVISALIALLIVMMALRRRETSPANAMIVAPLGQ